MEKTSTIKKFFKIIGTAGLIIASLIVALFIYLWFDNYLARKEQDKVKVEISYDTSKCKDGTPLYITVLNNSKKSVKYTNFSIEITREGYSEDLADYYSKNYKTDKIIEPGYVASGCWDYKLKPEYLIYRDPKNLDFKIEYKYVTFEE